MNLAQADFQQLRIKHILYKSKVRAMLYGGTYDDTFFSQVGPVGQWFATTGKPKYAHEPELSTLHDIQLELNRKAAEMHRQYKAGQIDEANDGLKTIEKKSDTFLEILSQLERRMMV